MASRANPAGQLLLMPLTAENQGAKIPSGSSQLERRGQVVRCLLYTLITPAPSEPLGSGGMEVTSVHPSKELMQELIQSPRRDT